MDGPGLPVDSPGREHGRRPCSSSSSRPPKGASEARHDVVLSPRSIIHGTRAEAEHHVALEIVELIADNPRAVIGVATGSTMTGVYRALISAAVERSLDASGVSCFSLDEYIGVPEGDARLFRSVLEGHLVDDLGLRPDQLITPDPRLAAESPEAASVAYERALEAAGGVDLQLLGIGRNGHVAFNEPGAQADSLTRTVPLEARTREDAAETFGGLAMTPEQAITVGIGTILRAKRLRLLAFGEVKAGIIARTLQGPVSEDVPATLLRAHPDLEFHLDAEASAEL